VGTNQNSTPRSPARKLAGSVAIGLAAGACVLGVGPSAAARVAPAVEGIAYSVSAAPAVGHRFQANDDGFTVNDTTGNSIADDAQFAVGTLALSDAETIAIHYWGVMPCDGVVDVSWQSLDPSINGVASWWNPTEAYGNPAGNSDCSLSLNTAQDYSWPMLCTVVTHEIGHLTGHAHVTDPSDVMYPVYVGPISQCLAPPIGVPEPASELTPAPAAHQVSATTASHKAKAAKKHKKAKKTKKKKSTRAKK
jgi:matrixin